MRREGGLRFCTPRGLERLARGLTIMDRRTATRELWVPNDEQIELWHLEHEHKFVFYAKARKIGASLAAVHADLQETNAADDAGNRMRTVFAIDTDAKALEHLERAADMASQYDMEVEVKRSPPYWLMFPNGSKLEFLTMGSDEPGRGGDIHRLHVTELPYAAHPEQAWTALRTACADSAPVLLETTLTSLDSFSASLWRGARRHKQTREMEPLGTEFHRHVSFVENQKSYRSDEPITDEEWEACKREGFTDRRAAAWWLKHALANLCSGNRVTLMHDYPQHRKHLLASSAGRVIDATPELALIDGHVEVQGLRGDTWNIEVYGDAVAWDTDGNVTATEMIDNSGQVVVTLDSAQGVGATNSIALAVDKRDRRPLACFWDNTIMHDDLARVGQAMWALFSPRRRTLLTQHDRCEVHCEADGAGRHTSHELTFLGVPHELFWQSKNNNAELCITQAKTRIEARPKGAPLILQEECDELQRDEKGHLKGPKDCLMMYGMANVVIDAKPYVPPPDREHEKDRRNRMSFEASLRDHDASNRAITRPKWGS